MTRRTALAVLLVSLACSPYRPLRDPAPRAPLTAAVVVPFTEVAGMIVVPARIGDDPAPLQLVFDSERSSTVLTPAAAARLGLRPRSVRYGGRYYDSYHHWAPVVALPPVTIGTLELAGGQAEVVDLDDLSRQLCVAIDGVLALDLWLTYEIDYAAGVLRIAGSAEQLPTRAGGIKLPSYVALDASPGALETSIEVATTLRTSIELSVWSEDRERWIETLGLAPETVVRDDLGQPFAWPDRRLGGLDLRGVDASIWKGLPELRLGTEVLRAFTVRKSPLGTWLYPNGRALPRGLVGFGFDWVVDGGVARIVGVSSGTEGLAVRDTIVAIDGQAIAAMSPEALCRLQRDWQDEREVVRVAVGGAAPAVREVEVRRRSLLADPRER